ncbi:Chitooligosaccharide deacetylase (modular protein) [uncultured Gammaproteobacteria bacterium]
MNGSDVNSSNNDDILFIVNSVFGARNTPGFRPWQLVRFDLARPLVIARGAKADYQPIIFPLPGRSLIPRGLNFLRIKFWPGLPARAIEQGLFDRLCEFASRRLKRRPRLVHLWDHLPRTAAYWKTQGVPLVLDLAMAHPRCYGPLIESGRVPAAQVGSLTDANADACIELADLIICPSVFVRDSLLPADRERAVVIPFGADPVAAPPERVRDKTGLIKVLFAGNVNPRKGIQFLLEAWRTLAPDPTRAELVVCGRQFQETAELVRKAPPGVSFSGFQGDMAPYFATADLFVLPSLMEGSAKAVYEAMAYGVPVVVTPNAGSVVTDGVEGLVVPPADVPALAAALARLIDDAELRHAMAAAARQTVAGYDWRVYATAVADVHRRFNQTHTPVARTPFARTYAEHMAPRPWRWKLGAAKEQARQAWRARSCTVDTTGSWLRFPFYHHVLDDERRGFAAHLEEMRRYGEFISLDQAVTLLESGQKIDGRYLCLSFDDGFRDNLTNALPIVAERDIPTAVFVASDLIAATPEECGPHHRAFFGPQRRPIPFLTWDECRVLHAAGVTIGSHSAGHRKFITLSGAEVEDELHRSKQAIERELGIECRHFCCPWGKPERDFVVERDPVLARKLGYRSFLTTSWGGMFGGESPFAIRRTGLVARFGAYQVRHALSL